jgi:soluble lytic murein transglycosylase-like protein
VPWPGVGPETSQALFSPDIKARCKKLGWADPAVVCGVIKNESNFDPGAVGFVDDSDLGLAQINGPAHPDSSEGERLQPIYSIDFVIGYLANATKALRDEDLAIASYNLGLGGARTWDKAGRPNPYAPAPGAPARDVEAYIQRIKTACRTT